MKRNDASYYGELFGKAELKKIADQHEVCIPTNRIRFLLLYFIWTLADCHSVHFDFVVAVI